MDWIRSPGWLVGLVGEDLGWQIREMGRSAYEFLFPFTSIHSVPWAFLVFFLILSGKFTTLFFFTTVRM